MKTYSKALFLVIALMLTVITAFTAITVSYRGTQTNVTVLNDMTETIREQWEEIGSFDSSPYASEMLIYSSENFLLYSTADHTLAGVDSPAKAMQEGCLCLPVHDGSRFLGTVVIPDPAKADYDAARKKLVAAAAVLLLGLLLAGGLYGLYVRNTIILPFRKMERFAADVAAGRLDTPLMLEKSNLFGAFTQSFDIMREELRASRQRELELKIKEKELIASLSHDLKTPITGIKLLCELMAVKVRDEYVLSKVENIHQKAEQINVLVADLLASALDELGEMQVTCRDEPAAMLHELVAEHDTRQLVREGAIPPCMICADRLVIASGGHADYAGRESGSRDILRLLGLSTVKPTPSLSPVNVSGDLLKPLKGVRAGAEATLLQDGRAVKTERGEVQFTENALSGICIFNLSREANRFGGEISLNLLPDYNSEQITDELTVRVQRDPDAPASEIFTGMLHKNLGLSLLKASGVKPSRLCKDISDKELSNLCRHLTDWRFVCEKSRDFRKAQVTAGGVRLSEIDPRTFEAKKHRGLYLIGEALDIDGDCGGYNLQFAFASGLCAGDCL